MFQKSNLLIFNSTLNHEMANDYPTTTVFFNLRNFRLGNFKGIM